MRFRAFMGCVAAAVLVAAVGLRGGRADDDVVEELKPQSPPAGGGVEVRIQEGRVILMPGLKLNFADGKLQIQGGGGPPAAAVAVRKQPFLGVVTGPVPAAVRAQLDLPEGVGVSIDAVAADGPAARAGVKQFDVLHRFNDQVVVSPEQLTRLVEIVGAGTRVPLVLSRGGRERVVEAELAEREVPVDAHGAEIPGVVVAEAGAAALGFPPAVVPQGIDAAALGPQVEAELRRRVAAAPGVAVAAAVVRHDARGSVQVRVDGGKKTVIVTDPAGRQVYAGPLDGAADLQKVPAGFRDFVREVAAGVRVRAPSPGPQAEGVAGPEAAIDPGPRPGGDDR